MDVDRLLEGRRVVITCGAGGVGKTTCAAAIGCRAAQTGRRVAVLTVDPARRLASSLGLENFDEVASNVAVPGADDGGELDAMMLDTSSTYDRLVKRYATNPEQAEAILSNKFYRHFSGAVGGSHEYTAMERLYELIEGGTYDLLVLDTPPTIRALDFLDAPQRLIDAFDESIFRWVIKPYIMAGRVGVQVLSFGSAYIFKTMTRFVGGEMIQDLSEFIYLFHGMFEGFRSRAKDVQELLHDDGTTFIIVATPQASSLQDAAVFFRELKRMKLPFGGFMINRTLPLLRAKIERAEIERRLCRSTEAGHTLSRDFLDRLFDSIKKYQSAAQQQHHSLKRFLSQISPAPALYFVPLFESDVADIDGLLKFSTSVKKENLR